MRFHSILFDGPFSIDQHTSAEPACFADLHLDQVVESITKGREDYQLRPFFHVPLHGTAAVQYRHDILHDLENEAVQKAITVFAQQLRRMRASLAQADKLYYRYQQQRWFLDAVDMYCGAINSLSADLSGLELNSRGLHTFAEYLAKYSESENVLQLRLETRTLYDDLAGVRYCILIRGNRVTVSKYGEVPDYSAEVEETFAKFKQGAVKDYLVKLPDHPAMDHVEARVLELVARLYPVPFQALEDYCARHRTFRDDTIMTFDREVQFYLAYLAFTQQLKAAGLPFCYPAVSASSKEILAQDTFDIALASNLVAEKSPVVRNDFALADAERIFVVTGPNQGGKTTFARMVGQVHYLASLGLPVPGSEARLFIPDRIFTHFEKEEDLSTLRGKLEDELVRIHDILEQATGKSIIIMNESFASTTLQDAVYLGTQALRQITELDALCVYVTFVDELASLSDATVSMVSTVVPDDPAVRTYKVVRQPADGLAYAAALAEKYRLTYESLKTRITRRSSAR